MKEKGYTFFFFSLQKQVGYNKIYIIWKIEKSFKKFKPYCIIQKETEMFNPFNMYNSVAFSILKEFWNHLYYLILEHFYHFMKKPHTHYQQLSRLHPASQTLVTTNLCSVTRDLSILDILCKCSQINRFLLRLAIST